MPLVVIEALMSIRIGSPPVGMPIAIGSGVNTRRAPAERRDAAFRRIGAGQEDHQPRAVARSR